MRWWGVLVRRRDDDDLEVCAGLARVVHARDGYPPRRSGDLDAFVTAAGALASFVAVADGEIVGHVALSPRSSREATDLMVAATGRSAAGLAVVARLIVAPDARRSGVARALLATATADAHRRGRWPVLDVATQFAAAIALYERCGWTRAGTVTVRLPPEPPLEEHVYLGPPPPP